MKLIVMDMQKGITVDALYNNDATWADYFAKCVSMDEALEMLKNPDQQTTLNQRST